MAATSDKPQPYEASTAPLSGFQLYSRFGFAGAVCCSLTHGALTPLDVVKTSIQLDPIKYNRGLLGGLKQLVAEQGVGSVWTGFGPTFVGYFLQGGLKFGGYELFKQLSIDALGYDAAAANRTAVYFASAAAAEFFADIALCPLEATRIRLVSDPGFADGLVGGFSKLARTEGLASFYSGFGPILFKQIPYTTAKFVVYEKVVEAIYARVDRTSLPDLARTAVNLGSGLVAGLAAAVISQPADTLLSKVNKVQLLPGEKISARLVRTAKEVGVRGSFAGVGARLFMVGTLTAFQFAIYGDVKAAIGAVGGVEIAPIKRDA